MTKFIEKLNTINQKIDNRIVQEQVDEINKIIETVAKKQVLMQAPCRLGLYPDEIEEITEDNDSNSVRIINNMLNSVRQFLSLKFGIWSLPNLTTAKLIKQEFKIKTCVEIMAGNAYWTKALNEVGIQTIATDSLEWAKTSSTGQNQFFNVENLNATDAIKKYNKVDLILCAWSPNFGKSDLEVIDTWRKYNPQARLLFIGEKNGATNSPEFWKLTHFKKTPELAKINQSFISYDFIDEKIFEVDEL